MLRVRPPSAFARRFSQFTLQRAGAQVTRLSLPPVVSPENSHSLSCCLIGPTNAGKSTLLNSLIDRRVSAVSSKIHTTRQCTLGYLTDVERATQVEFIDAPGSLGPDVPALHREVWEAVTQADLALIVVDSSDERSLRQVSRFLRRLDRELNALEDPSQGGAQRLKTSLVLNKVDRVRPKDRLLRVSRRLHNAFRFDYPTFMISALTGDGVRDLRNWLPLAAHPGEWSAPAGVAHVQPPLIRATEIIREQIYRCLSRELPYMIEQRNLGWTQLERPERALRIDQQLLLPKQSRSAKKILEKRLPGIATAARAALREEFECVVFLYLSIASTGQHELPVDSLAEVQLPD